MLVRIVHMSFEPENVPAFLELFDKTKYAIREFPGCQYLTLLRNLHEPHQFSTYSHWDNEDALHAYRNSALFDEVWKKTKAMFNDKPRAFSYQIQVDLP